MRSGSYKAWNKEPIRYLFNKLLLQELFHILLARPVLSKYIELGVQPVRFVMGVRDCKREKGERKKKKRKE